MAEAQVQTLQLSSSAADAVAAIRKALPEDAIIRGEDDAIGRFASERVVMVLSRDQRRLDLWRGSWRQVAARENDPQLRVELTEAPEGTTARLTVAPPPKPTLMSHLINLLGNMATVGLLVVAYYMFRDQEVDKVMVAAIGAGGGLLWSVIAHFMPRQQSAGLDELVIGALQPMREKSPETTAADQGGTSRQQ